MKNSVSTSRLCSSALVLSAAMVLAACGGGSETPTTVVQPPGGGVLPPVSSLPCDNVKNGGTGYVAGVCNATAGVGGVFQNYPLTVKRGSVLQSYDVSLGGAPVGNNTATAILAGEDCESNNAGNISLYTTFKFDAAANLTGPQWIVQALNESFGDKLGVCKQSDPNLQLQRRPAALGMTYLDAGQIERFASGTSAATGFSTYYAGWYSALSASNAAPAAAKTYSSGKAVASLVNQVGGAFGVGADVTASFASGTLTLSMANFSYKQCVASATSVTCINQTAPPPAGSTLTTVTASATVTGSTFSGTITGPTGLTGKFEGTFGGPTGQEIAGRFAIGFTGNGTVVVGGFGAK
jgi:hypothetical protein